VFKGLKTTEVWTWRLNVTWMSGLDDLDFGYGGWSVLWTDNEQ